jgi:hypothetical protein
MENRMKSRVLAVQDRRYKLLLDFENEREELFDLDTDHRELRALPTDAEASARARLLRWASQHLQRSTPALNLELKLRARLREIGLEWKNFKMNPSVLTD